MNVPAKQEILDAVCAWEGVSVAPHRFGGVEVRYGTRELGHIHGNDLADLPFPMAVRNELIQQGSAQPHHILPNSGWVSVPMNSAADVQHVIRLFRRSWELARKKKRPSSRATGPGVPEEQKKS